MCHSFLTSPHSLPFPSLLSFVSLVRFVGLCSISLFVLKSDKGETWTATDNLLCYDFIVSYTILASVVVIIRFYSPRVFAYSVWPMGNLGERRDEIFLTAIESVIAINIDWQQKALASCCLFPLSSFRLTAILSFFNLVFYCFAYSEAYTFTLHSSDEWLRILHFYNNECQINRTCGWINIPFRMYS